MSLLAMLYSHYKTAKMLEKSLSTEERPEVEYFVYKGKRYDKRKYISLLRKDLGTLSKRNMENILREDEKWIARHPANVLNTVRIEALKEEIAVTDPKKRNYFGFR